jgi:hypothetical protein
MDSSIKIKLDAYYTVNLVRLNFNSPVGEDKIWVLVEGEDDCKIYPKFFQETMCKIEEVHGGCGQLEIAISQLLKYTNQIIGIRDADFCHLTGNYSPYKNLFYTDCHDIEMTMIQNHTVFENILYEYFLQTEAFDIKKNILKEASFVGYIRYYNNKNNDSINFKEIPFGKIVTNRDNNLCLQEDLLIQELNNRSPDKTTEIDKNMVKQFIDSNEVKNLYQLVNGHDFIKLLSLRINLSIAVGKINPKDIAKSLRNTYRIDDFKQTQLYSKLLQWQTNLGYDILITNPA